MECVQAWVLHRAGTKDPSHAGLTLAPYRLDELADDEVLAEPLIGSWEGNMSHAIARAPIDICQLRRESPIVIGNAGVVRVLRTGSGVVTVRPGDICFLLALGAIDRLGYPETVVGYDAPGTVGLLAKRTKLKERQLVKVPEGSRHSLGQWAAFSVRYVTAWANWRKASRCWMSQFEPGEAPPLDVWAWGGGVGVAEAELALLHGASSSVVVASMDARLRYISGRGLCAIDRRGFAALAQETSSQRDDPEHRENYRRAERSFLECVDERTSGRGVAIFIDHIGASVYRATLKALGRHGVITTAGWKTGMTLTTVRALECIRWHTHVHTHGFRREEAMDAAAFAEAHDWMPQVDPPASWNDIPDLAARFSANTLDTYFPLYEVNAM